MSLLEENAQRLALAAWWESQPTKRKNAFVGTAVLARRVPPSPPARIVGWLLMRELNLAEAP